LVKIKICGITDEAAALTAARVGADFLGLVFAPGRRQVSVAQAACLAEVVKGTRNSPALVGVFVDFPADEVNAIACRCRLDWVQLSGHEDWDYCQCIDKPLIKVIHVKPGTQPAQVLAEINSRRVCRAPESLIFLLDTHYTDISGGGGRTFNWDIACQAGQSGPVMVAGGLTPDNITQLLEHCRPWGVDISSGVESAGRKDMNKIEAFINNVRRWENAGGKPQAEEK
jgi:phosphoribosylanthranilate isomerase